MNSDVEQLDLGPVGESSSPEAMSRARHRGDHDAGSSPTVAQVVVDTGLAHLDRPFSYLISADQELAAQPGVRVRVRFAGRDHDGFILSRSTTPEFAGTLSSIRRVVSPEVVLTPHLHRVARAVADHCAGTLSEVLRLAIPPRHAAAERALAPSPEPPLDHRSVRDTASQGPNVAGVADTPPISAWSQYSAGPAFLSRLAAGQDPAASWLALPGRTAERDWPGAIAEAVAATRRSGRGSVVVVPDQRDLAAVSAALDRVLGQNAHVQLSAEHGPSARYTAWLSLLRGHHNVVVGTRSAAYAPVQRPGLFVLWDELDDLHREPRSPYPHLRDVLRIRAADTGAGLLLSGFVRSVETAKALAEGVVRSVHASTDAVRAAMPAISVAGEGHQMSRDGAARTARLPSQAWQAIATGLNAGPVLVQVPRRGYLLALSCARCRHRLHCLTCHGPVQLEGPDDSPSCAWCGAEYADAPCPECASTRRRSGVIGERRTAYEIGRAFPGVEVRSSTAGQVLPKVTDERIIVVATPGAEPVAQGRYATTVLMDGWALADRAGLDAPLEALRRWSAAVALTRSRSDGGRVVLAGVPAHGGLRSVEALLRWDPAYLADTELTERQELALPPLRRVVSFAGDLSALRRVADQAHNEWDPERMPFEVLGPLKQRSGGSQLLVRTATAGALSNDEQLLLDFARWVRAQRSMSKATDALRIRVDPLDSFL